MQLAQGRKGRLLDTEAILKKLTLEEKCALLVGATNNAFIYTRF